MKARVTASVILAIGVVLGTAGCNLIAPQDTTKILKSTSFGVEQKVGDVDIRNAYLVADGSSVNLVATFVNSGDSDATLSIQPNGSADDTQTITVPTGDPLVVGDTTRVQFDNLDVSSGSLFPVFFSYGDKTGANVKLPVLTSDFEVNSTLTPTPTPTLTPTSTPTPSAG